MAKSKPRKKGPQIVLGEDIPQVHLQRLIKDRAAYTEKVNATRIEWPDPDDVNFDEPETDSLLDYDLTPDGFLSNPLGILNRAVAKAAKKKGGKGGGGQKAPKLPNPKVVHAAVAKSLTHIPLAGMSGNAQFAEFNGEFLDVSKARYFRDVYCEMFSRFHIVWLEEVEPAGVMQLATDLSAHTGFTYTGIPGTANTRSQAVGFLIHERYEILGTQEYHQVANVQGIPDLRPALRVDVRDKTTGETFSVVCLHLKSMRGGPAVTAAVRYKQLDILQQLLGLNFKGIVGGDLNFILDDPKLKDGDPLKNNGYTLFMPSDHTATQSMGSRIDGWFLKGMTRALLFYQVRAFFRDPNVTRAFSDHALLSFIMSFCEAMYQADPGTPNAGCPGGLTAKDFPVDVIQKVTDPQVKLLEFQTPA
ncbi:MAG: hypothetical protein K2W95_20500 [Candidatus Obscuribacterales bacterium]|nr:hypothetical protein [Candidatus Obscuribacterales bacterium]